MSYERNIIMGILNIFSDTFCRFVYSSLDWQGCTMKQDKQTVQIFFIYAVIITILLIMLILGLIFNPRLLKETEHGYMQIENMYKELNTRMDRLEHHKYKYLTGEVK